MQTYVQPRQSGKTTGIIDQINWCLLLDETPICVILPNLTMAAYFTKNIDQCRLTAEERSKIWILTPEHQGWAGQTFYFENTLMRKLQECRPKRIYIDEVFMIEKPLIDILQARYDNIIYAYGTPH